jgi:protein SCO1
MNILATAGTIAVTCGALLCSLTGASMATTEFDRDAALDISEASVGRTIGRYGFLSTDNKVTQLSQFTGKPLIISLIYTGCADVCPMVSEALADAVDTATATFGSDAFNVVTIGFDTENDTPGRMRSYARSHGIEMANWHFLSGSGAAIEQLADDMGFIFTPSSKGYDHMTRTSVIDNDGVIYRHIYGEQFDPPQLMEPLKDIIYGRAGNVVSLDGMINRIRLFCTIYDPVSGHYRFDYSIFISAGVALMAMGGTGFVLVRALVARRQRHS